MIFLINTIIYIDGVIYWPKYIYIFFEFFCVVNVSSMLASVANGGPAINQRLLLEQCQCRHAPTALGQHWDNAGSK